MEAKLNLSDVPRWLERYGLHFNAHRQTMRGLRFVNAIADPEAPDSFISLYQTRGGASVVLRTHPGLDCVAEIRPGDDPRVRDLLERSVGDLL